MSTTPLIHQINRANKIKHHKHKIYTFAKDVYGIDIPSQGLPTWSKSTYFVNLCFDCETKIMEMWFWQQITPYETEAWHTGHHTKYHPTECVWCMKDKTIECYNPVCPMHNNPFDKTKYKNRSLNS